MFRLSDEETEIVYARLQQEGIRNRRLADDLLDHVCCHMEQQMNEGVAFDTAYTHAVKDVYPNGAKEIEFELFFIMNFNKQVSMKKAIFLIGFVSVFLLSSGTMFKTMHWPAASILLFSGFSMLALTMILLGVYVFRFSPMQSSSSRLRTVIGAVSLLLIAVGFIFKTLHMPGANVMYGLGTILLNFIFLPIFFYSIYKNGFSKINTNEAA